MIGRLIKISGNRMEVQTPSGLLRCSFKGKLRQEKAVATRLAAVGDEVEVELAEPGSTDGVISKVLPRRSKLSRPDPASPRREQVIVANVDTMVIVHAAAQPDLDLLTIDKCTVMSQASGIPAAICINKSDLAQSDTVDLYRSLGYEVFRTCALKGDGIGPLRAFLDKKTSVFVGPSGVGKSSLVNAMRPDSKVVKTGDVSAKTGEGRHTTSWAELMELGPGTFIADTPGLEIFLLWGVEPGTLRDYFPEFVERAESCKFRDCRHMREPKCAVLDALKAGKITPSRHENYVRIYEILASQKPLFA